MIRFSAVFQILSVICFFGMYFYEKKVVADFFFSVTLQAINETEKTMLRIDRQLNISHRTDFGDTAKVRFVGFLLLYQQVA